MYPTKGTWSREGQELLRALEPFIRAAGKQLLKNPEVVSLFPAKLELGLFGTFWQGAALFCGPAPWHTDSLNLVGEFVFNIGITPESVPLTVYIGGTSVTVGLWELVLLNSHVMHAGVPAKQYPPPRPVAHGLNPNRCLLALWSNYAQYSSLITAQRNRHPLSRAEQFMQPVQVPTEGMSVPTCPNWSDN